VPSIVPALRELARQMEEERSMNMVFIEIDLVPPIPKTEQQRRLDVREELEVGAWFTAVWFWIVGLILAAFVIGYFSLPYFLEKEQTAIQASSSFVITQQTALADFKMEYDRVGVKISELQHQNASENADLIRDYKTQQVGIVGQMKRVANLIPGKVPADIQPFLATR
jgi:hypothetical protein